MNVTMEEVKLELPHNIKSWKSEQEMEDLLWNAWLACLAGDYSNGIGLSVYENTDGSPYYFMECQCGVHSNVTYMVANYRNTKHLYESWVASYKRASKTQRLRMMLDSFPAFVAFVQSRITELAKKIEFTPVEWDDSYLLMKVDPFGRELVCSTVTKGTLVAAKDLPGLASNSIKPYVLKDENGKFIFPDRPSWSRPCNTIGEAAKHWVELSIGSCSALRIIPMADAVKAGLVSKVSSSILSIPTFIDKAIERAIEEADNKESKRKKKKK